MSLRLIVLKCGSAATDSLSFSARTDMSLSNKAFEVSRPLSPKPSTLKDDEPSLKNPDIAEHLKWVYTGANNTPAEHRARIVRLIENLTFGMGSFAHSAAHGGGSGQACKMCVYEFTDLNRRKSMARRISGIEQ